MKLFYSPTSPYARKVRIVMLERGLDAGVEVVGVTPFENPVLAAANPLSKIPALVLESGQALYDSPVICEYLDSLGAAPQLIPENGDARWETLRLQALADGVLDAAFSMVMERRRPEPEQSQEWLGRWQASILRAIAAADLEPATRTGALNLGQISLACALGYLDFRHATIGWQGVARGLVGWFEDWKSQPSFAATTPP
jgi:glutathione S-transferase